MQAFARFALLTTIFLLGPAARATELDRATALIEAAKMATGGGAWDHIVTWHESGQVTASGLQGSYETWQDFPTLRNSGSFNLGPASGGQGWDGTRVWSTDSSREVHVQASAEAIAQAVQDAWRGAYAFYFPQRFPGKWEYAGTRQAGGTEFDAVKVFPKGAEPFELWFDRTSHRIAREVQLGGPQPHSYLLDDYRTVQGVSVPFQVTDRASDDPKYDMVVHTIKVEFLDGQDGSRYAPPPPPPNALHWPVGKTEVSLPFRLLNNHIYVDASINGGAPESFVFDTGAVGVLDAAGARRIGVQSQGALAGAGYGDKVSEFGFAKVASVSLGGLELADQVFATIDLAPLAQVEDSANLGLLGYEFLKRAVVRVDYANRTITFQRQDGFQPPKGAQVVPISFAEHVPMVKGSLDGVEGEFEVDTGARSALSLMRPFVDANGLIAKYHATRSATVGFGVGGPTRSLLGRAGELRIGDVRINAPVVEIALDKAGAGTATHTAGNIGGDILKRFTVTFDYANERMYLEPNASATERESFDRSGMWFHRADNGAIVVDDVVAGSAAAQAGIESGDTITAVDGIDGARIRLPQLRQRFQESAGTRIRLHVRGASGERDCVISLQDQV